MKIIRILKQIKQQKFNNAKAIRKRLILRKTEWEFSKITPKAKVEKSFMVNLIHPVKNQHLPIIWNKKSSVLEIVDDII